MLDALKQFAFGSRDPGSMRFDVLMFLKEKGAVDAGPNRVYSRGKWTEIQLLAAGMLSEPRDSALSPRVLEPLKDGMVATQEFDYELAEVRLKEALEEELR